MERAAKRKYFTGKGEMALVRMQDGRVEEIPWDFLNGKLGPVKIRRIKATFSDGPGMLKAMEAVMESK